RARRPARTAQRAGLLPTSSSAPAWSDASTWISFLARNRPGPSMRLLLRCAPKKSNLALAAGLAGSVATEPRCPDPGVRVAVLRWSGSVPAPPCLRRRECRPFGWFTAASTSRLGGSPVHPVYPDRAQGGPHVQAHPPADGRLSTVRGCHSEGHGV